MNQKIYIEKIEQYLQGQLSEVEHKAFEKELSVNKALSKQLQLIQEMDESLEDENALLTQKTIQEIGEDFFKENIVADETKNKQNAPIKRLSFYRRPWAIAASILLLVASVAILWQINSKSPAMSDEAIFAQYHNVEKMSPIVRSGLQKDSLYNMAVGQFNEKQYTSAINIFTTLTESNPDNWQYVYALANAYLNNNQPEPAKQQFQKIADQKKSILAPRSSWYLALIFIREGNKEAAKKQLNKLMTSEDSGLAAKAKELLTVLGD